MKIAAKYTKPSRKNMAQVGDVICVLQYDIDLSKVNINVSVSNSKGIA